MLEKTRCWVDTGLIIVGRRIPFFDLSTGAIQSAIMLFDLSTDVMVAIQLWRQRTTALVAFWILTLTLPLSIFWASNHHFASMVDALRNDNSEGRIMRARAVLMSLPIIGIFLILLEDIVRLLSSLIPRMPPTLRIPFSRTQAGELDLTIETPTFYDKIITPRTMNDLQKLINNEKSDYMEKRMAEARRYRAIIELLYETIPQIVFQFWVWLHYDRIDADIEVSAFELQLSIAASILHITMSMQWLRSEAKRRGVVTWRFLVFFMGGRLQDLRTQLHGLDRLDLSEGHHDLQHIVGTNEVLMLLSERLRSNGSDGERLRSNSNRNSNSTSSVVLPARYDRDVSLTTLNQLCKTLKERRHITLTLPTSCEAMREVERAYNAYHCDAKRMHLEMWRKSDEYIRSQHSWRERYSSSIGEWRSTYRMVCMRRKPAPHSLVIASYL